MFLDWHYGQANSYTNSLSLPGNGSSKLTASGYPGAQWLQHPLGAAAFLANSFPAISQCLHMRLRNGHQEASLRRLPRSTCASLARRIPGCSGQAKRRGERKPPRVDAPGSDPSCLDTCLPWANLKLDWKTPKCPQVFKWLRPRGGEGKVDSGGEGKTSQGDL